MRMNRNHWVRDKNLLRKGLQCLKPSTPQIHTPASQGTLTEAFSSLSLSWNWRNLWFSMKFKVPVNLLVQELWDQWERASLANRSVLLPVQCPTHFVLNESHLGWRRPDLLGQNPNTLSGSSIPSVPVRTVLCGLQHHLQANSETYMSKKKKKKKKEGFLDCIL